MKVEEFEKYLTEEELEMFKENLLKDGIDYKKHILRESTFWCVIVDAFEWKNTPKGQGFIFWEQISDRRQPIR